MSSHRALRRIFMWILFLVFFIVGSYLTVKMLGFVIDTQNMRLVKAAGIYLKYTPRDAVITLDGKLYPKTPGIFSNDIYISGLSPGDHAISLDSPGAHSWNKSYHLTPGMVGSSKDIILWKKNMPIVTSSTDTLQYWLTGSGLVRKTVSNTLVLDGVKIKGSEVKLSNSDSQYVVTTEGTAKYFVDLENTSSTINISTAFTALKQKNKLQDSSKIRDIISHPFSREKLFIITATSIYEIAPLDMKLTRIAEKKQILSYALSNTSLFIIDEKGTLTSINLLLGTQKEYVLHLSFAKDFASDPAGDNLFIRDAEGTLYHLDMNDESLKKFCANSAFYSFAPDGKRGICITQENIARVLYLKDYEENVIRKKYDESQFTLREQERPATFAWVPFNQNYFLIQTNGSLLVEEFDARTARNVNVLRNDSTGFSVNEKTLYTVDSKEVLNTFTLTD